MDSAGKKRLLGAVVVFAAAILFLPLLFSGAGVRTLESPMIPPTPELPDLNEVAPATANDAKRLEADISASHGEPTFYPIQPPQVTVDEPVSEVQEQFRIVTPSTKAAEAKPVAPAPKPVIKAEPVVAKPIPEPVKASAKPVAAPAVSAEAKKAEEARKTTTAATTLPSAWVVQIASLSNKANAEALVAQLRTKGYRASLSAGNNVWRVVIGPELDRAVAENTRAKVLADDSLKMDAIIMPYRP
jgi:DedD protein